MKVSVIVPVYNASEFLDDCLQSILSQTYEDLEIILIEDGSPDNSGEICDRYKEKDDRILVVHQNNQGVSNARNKGIDLASGQLLTFVDSDDTIDRDMIRTLYDDLMESQADIAICSYRTFNGDRAEDIGNSGKKYVFSKEEAIENLIAGRYFIGGLCTKLYKADVIQNIRLKEGIRINEDVLMNFYVFENAENVLFHDACLYNYRANVKGATNSITQILGRADEYLVAKEMFEHCKGKSYLQAAEKRYSVSMLNYYQSYVMAGRGREQEAIQLKKQLKKEKAIQKLNSKPQKVRCFLFLTVPGIAKRIYQIHEKTRTVRHAPKFE